MQKFKTQIEEDIKIIQQSWIDIDKNYGKQEYVFNHWILENIYNIDDELIPSYITEYNDKSIDCFVHYEDDKELYIIQNKYYNSETSLDRKEVSDFLSTPISVLKSNSYKRNKELQNAFYKAITNPDYKIFFHFYITNSKANPDFIKLFKDFNLRDREGEKAQIIGEMFYIQNIYEKYYGTNYKENISFKYTLDTKNKGTRLQILPEQYELSGMSEAYYIMTPVYQIYEMFNQAEAKQYPLFEENIREYLGKSKINNGIIRTLKSKEERKNFFYYNNGITITCESTKRLSGAKYSVELKQPQIVNGCQTVNTIHNQLSNYIDNITAKKEFSGVFVMVKVLIFNDKIKAEKPDFYKKIVKYTNSQNSINENAFGASKSFFNNIQKYFKQRGFLLLVQPSDRYKFKTIYDKTEVDKLLNNANNYSEKVNLKLTKLTDIIIPLDKMLQIYLALIIDGAMSYKSKSMVLKQNSPIYKKYSTKIQDYLTWDNMIRLFLLFKKSEIDRKQNTDKTIPIPYYLIGFLGFFVKDDDYNYVIERLFSLSNEKFSDIYNYLKSLTKLYSMHYRKEFEVEYNVMIKNKIDIDILNSQIENINAINGNQIKNYIFDNN